MRKFTLNLLILFLAASYSFAGGIVTNTNQSSAWVRLLVRDATTEIDAVYFNPAGLTKLNDGFHFSISNQYITQGKEILNNYTFLNDGLYEGVVKAPIFPDAYAAYKTGNVVFSLGFNPIGGGGGATFDRGLPSFEMGISDLVPGLQAAGQPVTAYSLNTFFEGTSVYFGLQAGVSIALSDEFSFFVGGRYISAVNTYNGYLKDVAITLGGTVTPANTFFTGVASQYTDGAALATAGGIGMQPLIDGGAGSLTFAQAEGLGIIDAVQRAQMEGGLTALGMDPTGMTLTVAQASFFGAASSMTTSAAEYSAKAALLSNQEADVKQKGWGLTTIIGFNYSPTDDLNIGFKYESATRIELKNETAKDFTVGYTSTGVPITMFPEGEINRADMPAMVSLGFDYQIFSKLSVTSGVHYYFDKSVNYGRSVSGVAVKNEDVIDNNYWEVGIGLEYALTDQFFVSAGYLSANSGVSENYQTDLSYSLSSNTFGGGLKYALSEKMALNLGVGYTFYKDGSRVFNHLLGAVDIPVTESYTKNNLVIGAGFDFSF
ncbi:MAG: outer membrane protein transport protein [Bacteroidetes bacterium]|nr:outer membrane protein transport protein [Bacteroidota bacterium]